MTLIANNKRAGFDYEFLEKFTAGLVLTGPETKAAKGGQANLSGSFVVVRLRGKGRPEAFLTNAHISPYRYAGNKADYDPKRTRKLLLRRSEISRLLGIQQQKGLTLVPLRLYTERSLVKLEFAVARGKRAFDKRQAIRERELKRRLQSVTRGSVKLRS